MSRESKATKEEIQRNRAEAYLNGWSDGYAEGYGKATVAALPPAPDAVEALVKAAEAQERERCAKVAESYWSGIPESEVGEAVCDAVFAVSAAIRAGRG
jgi:flagellar biosynthesis/type III secretory pathway protein FliH